MKNILERINLERRRDALIQELHGLGNLMRGSLVSARVKCGRKGCQCEAGEKHEKVHLCLTFRGQTRNRYIGRLRQDDVAALVREYQRAKRIIEDLTEVNLELLEGNHPGGQMRRKSR